METKELKVGDYIKGFKYDCSEDLEELMNNHVGEIGIIVEKHEDTVKVEFEDGLTWHYPNYKAIEHLVDTLEDTPFHKPDFSHLREKIEKGVNIRFESKSVEDLKLDSLKREMETKTIKVGDYIRGFNSANPKRGVLPIKYLGNKAEVMEVFPNGELVVRFSDGLTWMYEYIEAIENIWEEDFKKCTKGLDNINPSHYKRLPKETIDRIQDNLTESEFKGYIKGNILKYLDRYQDKNGVEDLKKANWYLNKLIEIETK